MARRSSARIRNRNSSTPKRVSLSHDALPYTPRTAPVKLQTLREHDAMPGAFPGSESPPTPRGNNTTTKVPVNFNDATPEKTTPIKPAANEMHPVHHQNSTAKLWDEARWLGISNMAPHTEPPKQASEIAMLQATPTKASESSNDSTSPRFKFTFAREVSLELSPEAKKLMSEKREEALKIRAQMVANGEGPANATADQMGRRIATPKGKKNRFSEVHLEQFRKMDSIAGHASAFRADPSRSTKAGLADMGTIPTAKSLKRSPSKAGLEELGRVESQAAPIKSPKAVPTRKEVAAGQDRDQSPAEATPRKRVKHSDANDERTETAKKSENASVLATTPKRKQALALSGYSDIQSTVASPTQAFLARTASVKSPQITKIPGPVHLAGTPKAATKEGRNVTKSSTPLLARFPSRSALLISPATKATKGMGTIQSMSPLLMRSPSKPSPIKNAASGTEEKEASVKKVPLLSRSPLKMSKNSNADVNCDESEKPPPIAFLAQSPTKIKMPGAGAEGQNDVQSTPSGLVGRFKLLRSTPMKSILRSPQRLYSNDPAKVAAGTHLASPASAFAKKSVTTDPSPSGMTATEKRVDFSSSTKARYERAQSEAKDSPVPKGSSSESKSPAKVSFVDYPTLPTAVNDASVTSPECRQSVLPPGDFTFGSHGKGIIFGQSPNAPASAANSSRPSTIRHVSAEPERGRLQPFAPVAAAGGKKRKFEDDNSGGVESAKGNEGMAIGAEEQNKENVGEDSDSERRPTKRMKPSAVPSVAPVAPNPTKTRPPTLGVKPKKGSANDGKDKKPSVISRARLNALAQPKRKV